MMRTRISVKTLVLLVVCSFVVGAGGYTGFHFFFNDGVLGGNDGDMATSSCSSLPNHKTSAFEYTEIQLASYSEVGPETSNGVVRAYGTEPTTMLIPSMVYEYGGYAVVELIYEGLTRYDADGTTELALAESINTNDGGKTWNVTLKKGKKFSDDSPVTSHSFVDAWNWGADPANEALQSYLFEPIEGYPFDLDAKYSGLTGLKVVSDTEFTITLTEADPEFDKQLGNNAFYPLPKSAFASKEAMDKQGEKPVSNGPYMLKKWEHDKQIELVPNPKYDGDAPAKNGGVTFKMYLNDTAAYNDLVIGDLDVMDSIPSANISTFEDQFGERAINQDGAIWQSFTIPYYLEHFGNDEEGCLRRQAISMSINRQEIADTVFDGTRTPATDFVADVILGHSDSIKGNDVLEYNPKKAKALWEQANEISDWGDSTFEIAYNADGAHEEWVDAVVQQIGQNLDIDAKAKVYDTFAELREDANGGKMTSALRTGWQADYPSVYSFLMPVYGSDSATNDARYDNPEFERVLEDARSQSDESARLKGYEEAQEILMRDLPAIPLWSQNVLGAYSDSVRNVQFNWKSVPVYQDILKN